MTGYRIPLRYFALAIVLVTIATITITVLSLSAHQSAIQQLVLERNEHTAQLTAQAVGRDLQDTVLSPTVLADSVLKNLPENRDLTIFIIDQDGNIIFQRNQLHHDSLLEHAGVQAALDGKLGSVLSPAANGNHVIAYAPIAPYNLALILEEPWQQISSPLVNTSAVAALVIILLIGLLSILLWLGTRQIVQPLQQLTYQALSAAEGDTQALESGVGGIEEIQWLQQELITMTRQAQDAQDKLRSYARTIVAGQEDERKRIARDLHDGLIQSLTVLHQEVQLAQYDWAEPQMQAQLDTMQQQVSALTHETRRIVRALRPSYLEELGLIPAIKMLVKDQQIKQQMPINLSVDGEIGRLSAEVETTLYRITQEALNNIWKHAQATQADVSVTRHPDHIQLVVSDDGVGIPLAHIHSAPNKFGLLGIYERTELLQGHVAVQPNAAASSGTQVSVTIPFVSASTD